MLRDESNRLTHEKTGMAERVKVRLRRLGGMCRLQRARAGRAAAAAVALPSAFLPCVAELPLLSRHAACLPPAADLPAAPRSAAAHPAPPACLPAAPPPPPRQENHEKIKLNNQLPYLVANIVEVLDVDPEEEEEEDGALPPRGPAGRGRGGCAAGS